MLRQKIIDIISEIEASIDFPEEDVDTLETENLIHSVDEIIGSINKLAETYTGGRIMREGYTVAIAGRPNSGKSSLFNLLLRQERALVTPAPGTTRDYLSEWIDFGGFAVNLIDTAGLRERGGPIEKAGQKSAMKIVSKADLLLWMVDLSERDWTNKLDSDSHFVRKHNNLLIGNKIDLPKDPRRVSKYAEALHLTPISCLTGKGINHLKKKLLECINAKMPDLTSGVMVTSARHQQKLKQAVKHLRASKKKMSQSDSPEITAFELRQAAGAIDEITGKVYTEDILDRIFSRFCIGK
jgi:tRNA modification GTPase